MIIKILEYFRLSIVHILSLEKGIRDSTNELEQIFFFLLHHFNILKRPISRNATLTKISVSFSNHEQFSVLFMF